jgi:hypothetical protein
MPLEMFLEKRANLAKYDERAGLATPIYIKDSTDSTEYKVNYTLENNKQLHKTSFVILPHRYTLFASDLLNFGSDRRACPYDYRLNEESYERLMTKLLPLRKVYVHITINASEYTEHIYHLRTVSVHL